MLSLLTETEETAPLADQGAKLPPMLEVFGAFDMFDQCKIPTCVSALGRHFTFKFNFLCFIHLLFAIVFIILSSALIKCLHISRRVVTHLTTIDNDYFYSFSLCDFLFLTFLICLYHF